MNPSVHIDNEKKDILILCKGSSDNTVLTAKKKYSLSFTEQRKKFFKVCIIIEWIVIYLLIVQIQNKRFWNKCISVMFG